MPAITCPRCGRPVRISVAGPCFCDEADLPRMHVHLDIAELEQRRHAPCFTTPPDGGEPLPLAG